MTAVETTSPFTYRDCEVPGGHFDMSESRAKIAHRPFRRIVCLITLCLGLVGIGVFDAAASSYNPRIPFPPACGTCRMNANEALTDGTWTVKMQGDGNLVMRNGAGTVCFASNTAGHSSAHVSYQSDGNFVVYSTGGSALWASNTSWVGSAYSVSVHLGQFYVGNTLIHGPC
jgi:hypothetical protein